jgi:hypothetical protein
LNGKKAAKGANRLQLRDKWANLPRMVIQLSSLTLYFLPFLFLLYAVMENILPGFRTSGGPWLFALQFPLYGIGGYLLAHRPGVWRSILHTLEIAALVALLSLLFNGFTLSGLLLLPVGFVLSIRCKFMLVRGGGQGFQASFVIIGLIGYFLLPLLVMLQPLLKPHAGGLNLIGIVALALFLFNLSKDQVQHASQRQGQGQEGSAVLGKTRMWTAVLFALVLMLGYFREIGSVIGQAATSVVRFFFYLLGLLLPGSEVKTPTGEPASQPMLPPMGETKPNPFLDLLAEIAKYLVFAALVAGAIYLLYRLLRQVPGLLSRLKQFLAGVLGGVDRTSSSGYVDKKESLLELRETPRLFLTKARNWLSLRRNREPSWSELTDNRQRMRYLFRTVMRQATSSGFAYQRERTPLENGEALATRDNHSAQAVEALAQQYSAVRYGQQVPADTEVEDLANRFLKSRS